MEPIVIFEDESVLVLDKPAGWIVNEAITTKDRPVLQSFIKKNFNFETSESKKFRSGIVHRLDKETSGVILIAKTKKAFTDLQDQFKKRLVEKKYVALLHGELKPESGNVEVPLGRLPWNRERFGVIPGGRESETRYKVLEYYKKDGEKFSLTEFYPLTGRTHQIRIHAKYLGYPIVSDEFYSGRKTSRNDRKWCKRLFLHAIELKFLNPETKKEMVVNSSLPEELHEALDYLIK